MSDISDSNSDSDSDYYPSDDGSSGSEDSYSSIADALAGMMAQFEALESGLDAMTTTTTTMSAPVAHVAVATFKQPRVLEAAPFRAERFRLKASARAMFGTEATVVTFAELCALLRGGGGSDVPLLERLLEIEQYIE